MSGTKFDSPKKIRIFFSTEAAARYIDVTADYIEINDKSCTADKEGETVAEFSPKYFVAWRIVEK